GRVGCVYQSNSRHRETAPPARPGPGSRRAVLAGGPRRCREDSPVEARASQRDRHQLREYLSGRESRERLLLRFSECGKGHTACPKPFRARPTDSFSSRCLSRLLRGEASGAAESAVGKIMAHDGSLPCARPHSAIPYRKATTAVSGCRGRGPSRMRLYERLHAPDGAMNHDREIDADYLE